MYRDSLHHLRTIWQDISPRERRLISWGVGLLLPILVYMQIWQPIQTQRERLAVRVEELRNQLAQMLAAGEEARRLRALPSRRLVISPAQAARRAAGRFQIQDNLQAVADNADQAQVSFSQVPFSAWTRWLAELDHMGIVIRSCDVAVSETPGLVNASVVLARRNGEMGASP